MDIEVWCAGGFLALNRVELAVVALHVKMEKMRTLWQMKTGGEQQDDTDKHLLARG